jgi:hypothetical protein
LKPETDIPGISIDYFKLTSFQTNFICIDKGVEEEEEKKNIREAKDKGVENVRKKETDRLRKDKTITL